MRKNIQILLFAVFLIGCTAAPEEKTNMPEESLGEAPELENEVWLNTSSPLRLADLRGRVVLLEMWTFG
jgi:hypothetical protein